MNPKHIPNILSALRILMIPVFVYLFFEYYQQIYIALFVFLLAGLTDIIDGYLARRNGWITNLGKLLDPLADKLMQCAVLVCFAIKNIAPWWLAALFILKELFMICGALVVFKKIKITVKSLWYGKATTAIFYIIMFVVFTLKILGVNLDDTRIEILFMIALVFALFSMIMYIIDTSRLNAARKKSDIK